MAPKAAQALLGLGGSLGLLLPVPQQLGAGGGGPHVEPQTGGFLV